MVRRGDMSITKAPGFDTSIMTEEPRPPGMGPKATLPDGGIETVLLFQQKDLSTTPSTILREPSVIWAPSAATISHLISPVELPQ